MKVLMVEEDVLLAELLRGLLQKNGYETEWLWDSEEGVFLAEAGQFDLMILDGETNGCELARRLRQRHCGIPILMLTETEGVEDEIRCLEAGADYCLAKLFDSRRLLAYVGALLRRQGEQRDVLVVGDLFLNLSNCVLSCEGKEIRLSAKEFDVMRFLMSSGGRLLPKKQILCRVWGYDTEAVENHVEVYIGRLRKKLTQLGAHVQIKAIRYLGYVMETE